MDSPRELGLLASQDIPNFVQRTPSTDPRLYSLDCKYPLVVPNIARIENLTNFTADPQNVYSSSGIATAMNGSSLLPILYDSNLAQVACLPPTSPISRDTMRFNIRESEESTALEMRGPFQPPSIFTEMQTPEEVNFMKPYWRV